MNGSLFDTDPDDTSAEEIPEDAHWSQATRQIMAAYTKSKKHADRRYEAFQMPTQAPSPLLPEKPADLYPKIEGRMKSWPAFYQAIIDGDKLHDFRSKKDRDFAVGQVWLLEEYDPFDGAYTGRRQAVQITYMTSNDTPCAYSSAVLDRDAVVLSIKTIDSPKNRS